MGQALFVGFVFALHELPSVCGRGKRKSNTAGDLLAGQGNFGENHGLFS